jgi:hypothetical protein
VVATNFSPLALSTKVMVAPETTAPVGSFTTPRREVVAFWARLLAVQIDNSKKSAVSQIRLVKGPSKENKTVELRLISEHTQVSEFSSFVCAERNCKA